MKKMRLFTLPLLCWLAFSPPTSAQTSPIDSLRKIMYDQEALPAKRRAARTAILEMQREEAERVYNARPQQLLLKNARRSLETLQAAEDSILNQLLYLAATDTLADNYEKMEAVAALSAWTEHAQPKQDLIVAQFSKLLQDTAADLYDFQKMATIQALVRSKNSRAYPSLMDHIGCLYTVDDFGNANYWFSKREPTGNWALFPEILRIMAKEDMTGVEHIVLVTLLLDKIVQDRAILAAMLDLYEQKTQNPIFTKNKKQVVELLELLH